MKKSFLLTLIICIFAIVISVGCSKKSQQDTIKLYFSNAEKTELKIEERPFEKKGNISVDEILNELLNGPKDPLLARIIPKGTKLLNTEKKGDTINIDLSSTYMSASPSDELLARHSIAKTLFELDNISSIKIFVNGVELLDSQGQPVGEISKQSLITTPTQNSKKTTTVTLYFSDDSATYLVAEARDVQLVDNSLEKTIITELIKGPENKNLNATIPEESKLLSVETKDSICFVNFSQSFVSKHNGGSTGEYMTVYSIVNSLTELPNVEKVQFLVEGNKIDVFKHMEFNEPFSRDVNVIKK